LVDIFIVWGFCVRFRFDGDAGYFCRRIWVIFIMIGLSGREVDIVFCIDGTKTMQFIIEEIKAEMQSFYAMYEQEAKEKELVTNRLRVKFIIFRTFGEEGVKAIEESPFYELPSQQNEMMDFVQGIEAKGNARNGANALEAIALALQSDWTTASGRKRHIILTITDKPAIPLGAKKDCPDYPQDMPEDLAKLGAIWEGVVEDQSMKTYLPKAGRLLVFAPREESWEALEMWNRYWYVITSPDAWEVFGLPEIAYILVDSI